MRHANRPSMCSGPDAGWFCATLESLVSPVFNVSATRRNGLTPHAGHDQRSESPARNAASHLLRLIPISQMWRLSLRLAFDPDLPQPSYGSWERRFRAVLRQEEALLRQPIEDAAATRLGIPATILTSLLAHAII